MQPAPLVDDIGGALGRRISLTVPIVITVLVVITTLIAAGCASGGGGRLSAGHGAGTVPPPATTSRPPRTTAVTAGPQTATSPPTSAAAKTASPELPPPADGRLPQTTTRPSTDTAVFRAEMGALWSAITLGRPSLADRAFFPEAAYLQVKALDDYAADYTYRLVAHFRLDVEAAHRFLGTANSRVTLLGVLVPPGQTAWIPPGACYNRIGYWHLPGARLVYRDHHQERSIGIASMISWRGTWYVVHLGAVLPPQDQGTVDDPAVGVGPFDPTGGC